MTPLTGKRILVTRPRAQAADLCDRLSALGAIPVQFPTIEIAPLDDSAALDAAIGRLADYQWVIFTSVNGVSAFWQRLEAAHRDSTALDGIRVAAIGPATARALTRRGIAAQFTPDEYVAEAIVAGIGDVRGQRILLPRADIARETLADGLRQMGASVDEIAAYHTLIVDAKDPATLNVRAMLERGQIDAITFTSASTVRGFMHAIDLRAEIQNQKSQIVIACIGPITAQTARELGLPVNVMATEYTMDGLVAALVRYFQEV
jgi:uroporphyrinogen III methyltransferase/synthase